jgi:hypothetical protein
MPVFEQGYRPYEGPLANRSPLLTMVWHNFRTRVRWWIWLLAAALLAYPYLVFGVVIFLFTAGTSMFGIELPGGVAAPMTFAYEMRAEPDPTRLMAMLMADSAEGALPLYWMIMEQASFAALVLPAVACGGILATDRRTGAMQIYFARPVTRAQYMFSKVLTVMLFTAAVTTLPTLAMWLETVAFHPEPVFVFRTWLAPFSIVGAGLFYGLWSAAIILTLSTLFDRPVLASISAIFLQLLLAFLGAMMSRGLDDNAWRMLNPRYALGGLVAPLFGLDLPPWLETPWLVVPSLIVPLLLLAWVWSRVRAVEVTT